MLQETEKILATKTTPDADQPGAAPAIPAAVPARQMPPPKGSCWYCARPLDNVRRFCGKDCAAAFNEEAQFTR